MKRLFPGLSNLFASWASAGQYSSVAELELDQVSNPGNNTKVVALPRSGNTASSGATTKPAVRRRLG